MIKALWKFLKGNKANWITFVTLLLGIIGLVFGFVFDHFSTQVIAGMFLLIAVQNFMMMITYLDEMKAKLNKLNPIFAYDVIVKRDSNCDSNTRVLEQAKSEIYIVGSSSYIQHLTAGLDLVVTKPYLKLRLLVLNHNNKTLHKMYLEFRRHSSHEQFSINQFKKYKGKPQIEVKTLDIIPAVAFLGRDMNTDDGYIRATHLMNSSNRSELPTLELTPSNKEWYEYYLGVMNDLWEIGKPYE